MALYLGTQKVCPIIKVGGNDIGLTREVSASGVYQFPEQSFTFSLPDNATDVGPFAMNYAFCNCTGLTSIDLSNLTTISGQRAMYCAFQRCTGLTSIDLSNLTTISGLNAMYGAFQGCSDLTSIDLSNLTTISGQNAMYYAFQQCHKLKELSFPSLIFGSNYNGFETMLSGVVKCTVHFPSNLEPIIGSWTSVQNGFGGTSTIVLFDLPATT